MSQFIPYHPNDSDTKRILAGFAPVWKRVTGSESAADPAMAAPASAGRPAPDAPPKQPKKKCRCGRCPCRKRRCR